MSRSNVAMFLCGMCWRQLWPLARLITCRMVCFFNHQCLLPNSRIEMNPMNHITQEHQLVARLQSLLARMSNDERTSTMFEADGDTLRDAMEYIRKAARSQPVPVEPQPDMKDAYVGAREDVAIWKNRALEAESLNRKFIAEVNGPTFMGDPLVTYAQPEPVSPLSREKMKEILRKSGYDKVSAEKRADFINGVRHGEVAHGVRETASKGGAV